MFKEEKSEINRERVQLLLDYLVRHEKRYEEAMRQAEKEPSGSEEATKIQKNWHQYVPKGEQLTTEGVELNPDMTLEEVTNAAMTLDNRLVTFFQNQANNPSIPDDLQEIFQKMAEQEDQEKAKLSKTVNQLRGL